MKLCKVKIFLEMIKFEHTLFALPFAYIGALVVNKRIPSLHALGWITLAMVGARTAAMSLNRLIDRYIDAQNPRTAGRAIPKGLISVGEVWFYVFFSVGLFIYAAWQLNALAVKLLPVALFVLFIYPYMKRFSWTAHLVLGIALGLAPLGSWIAITGSFALAPILLALGVVFWVAGFDIIYACDDYNFDRKAGLHSIPVRFGIATALKISLVFHILAPLFFLAAGIILKLGAFYGMGVLVSIAILIYEHWLVSPNDLSKGGVAFFNMNGILSVSMLGFTFLDIIFRYPLL